MVTPNKKYLEDARRRGYMHKMGFLGGRGGASLQGRYHYPRPHPLSFGEIGGSSQSDLESLMTLGGFPEPFNSSWEWKAKRWSKEYRTRLIRDDLPQLERVSE